MKLALILLAAVATAPTWVAAQDVASVRNVYLLPMRNSFEQYLANQLTAQGVFRVVTDPQKADAIFSDHIGAKFERYLEELYPPPPEPEPEESTEGEAPDALNPAPPDEETQDQRPPISSFSRGRGNLFLVDRESRTVLWSTYFRPKSSSSENLHKIASKIVEDIQGTRLGGR